MKIEEDETGFKIVIASGTHLGFREDNKELECDPIDTLEEVIE